MPLTTNQHPFLLLFLNTTYDSGLIAVIQYQFCPPSGTVMVSTSATLARLRRVQKTRKEAWLRLGVMMPSKLESRAARKCSGFGVWGWGFGWG